MKKICLTLIIYTSLVLGCNNEEKNNKAADIDLLIPVMNKDEAIAWIKRYHANDSIYRLKMFRFNARKLNGLISSADTARFWMAADADSNITVILQHKKMAGSKEFKYYDINSVHSIGKMKISALLCPEPQDCYLQIED